MAGKRKEAREAPAPRAWVAAANMGMGHKRAVQPLADLAEGGILIVNAPGFADEDELRLWERLRKIYEKLSRARGIPIVGPALFGMLDYFQRIRSPYPRVDLSAPTVQTRFVDSMLKKGLCRSLLRKIREKPLPLVTSFYHPAVAADRTGWGRIYCIICDADINRVWVSSRPRDSRIEYLVPCGSAMRRLRQYGVPDERIWMTGFPLPRGLLGNQGLDVLRKDLGRRIRRLDPEVVFRPLHGRTVEHFLGPDNLLPGRDGGPVTITFAVGGAGAQKEIGAEALASLAPAILAGRFAMNLVCGVRQEVREYFEEAVRNCLPDHPGVRIVHGRTDSEYFAAFEECLHGTDILWTKPSELSFYTGLGIPLITAPAIGSQEDFNLRWLREIQAALPQSDTRYTLDWIQELLEQGRFAEAAWSGFLKARKYGTYKIHEILATGSMERESNPLRR
ncbi:MAG TPA: hypothetical protein VLH39_01010 [Magnetospirillaceae bacterium]|nr:hypothetical protein [Magnetospirillaceae bacterium]